MSSEFSSRVYDAVSRIVPQLTDLGPSDAPRTLAELGFDSLAMISLFVVLEEEFQLTVSAMSRYLHKRCTLGGVLTLCSEPEHASSLGC